MNITENLTQSITTTTTTTTTTTPTTTASPTDEFVGETLSLTTRIIFIIIGIIYTFLGVMGNLLIIVTIFVTKTMRNPHYYFIVNLAIADIIITGYVIPHLVVSLIIHVYPVKDLDYCVVNGITTVTAFVASLLTLMTISINRYLSVCRHQVFDRIYANSVSTSIGGCVLIWVTAFLTTLPCLVGWGRFTFDKKTHYCGYDRTYSFSYTLFLMLFSIATPACVIFVCNFAIWRFVRASSHKIYDQTHQDLPSETDSETSNSQEEDDKTVPSVKKNQVAPEPNRSSSKGVTNTDTATATATRLTQRAGDNKQKPGQSKEISKPGQEPKGKSFPGVGSKGREPSGHSKGGHHDHSHHHSHHHHHHHHHHHDHDHHSKHHHHILVTPGELALMKTIFTIFLTFAVFMVPYMMSTLLDTTDQWSPITHMVCSFACFTNSCLNCVLYGLMTPAFKKAYTKLLPCLGPHDHGNQHPNQHHGNEHDHHGDHH